MKRGQTKEIGTLTVVGSGAARARPLLSAAVHLRQNALEFVVGVTIWRTLWYRAHCGTDLGRGVRQM